MTLSIWRNISGSWSRYHITLKTAYSGGGKPLPVTRYHSSSGTRSKKRAAWAVARVSDQMGVRSRSKLPPRSRGTTPRLWPEMPQHSISFTSTCAWCSNWRVLSITARHQSSGRCSCQPGAG